MQKLQKRLMRNLKYLQSLIKVQNLVIIQALKAANIETQFKILPTYMNKADIKVASTLTEPEMLSWTLKQLLQYLRKLKAPSILKSSFGAPSQGSRSKLR